MWHLLSAGMLSEYTAIEFLESTLDESMDLLIDDLRESMTVFPHSCKSDWETYADYRFSKKGRTAWSWNRFRRLSAWKKPLEICRLAGRPLVPANVDSRRMHKVVAAANEASIRHLGIARG